MVLRYARKFTSIDGTEVVTFPLAERRAITTQFLRSALFPVPGRNYPIRALAYGAGLKAESRETISFVLMDPNRKPTTVDAKWDTMKSTLYSIGVGKLWSYDEQENMRWAWAYIEQMPTAPTYASINRYHLDVTVTFIRISDWYGATAMTPSSVAIAASPTTFTLSNVGNAPVYNPVFTVFGVYSQVSIYNSTTGHYMIQQRTGASANDGIRFSPGVPSVERTTDAGVTWTGDYANFLRVTGQVRMMEIAPGDNAFSVAGITNGTLSIDAYPAYH